ncbi:hypothetical protein BD413DRAFT_605129 [Trametes elegans]|nr:hypothetical protein BD413DRAFT_605129 [Trametes elegans]
MDLLKKIVPGRNTPRAPKHGTIPLPDLTPPSGNVVPPLVSSWSSSESSSSGTPSPITPSPRSSPVARRADMHDISRNSTPDSLAQDKARSRQTSTPAIEIVKPTPRRPYAHALPPTTVTVMNAVVPPPPALEIPPKPLKGILKQTRLPAHQGRPRSSASRHPSVSVATLSLHWQLLPPNEACRRRGKYLHFDVAKSLDHVEVKNHPTDRLPATGKKFKYIQQDLLKEACSTIQLRTMIIRYEKIKDRDIHVNPKHGDTITCLDILEAIYEFFDTIMSPKEAAHYIKKPDHLQRCEAAFYRRCEESERRVAPAERELGLRFVDLLEGNTVFQGLRRPYGGSAPPDLCWVVEFGPRDAIHNCTPRRI